MSESKKEAKKCSVHGCDNKPKTARSQFCMTHYKARRKAQLKANNVTWKKRVEAGKAKHHLTYRGKLTEWAKDAPKTATEQATRMTKADVPSLQQFGQVALKQLSKLNSAPKAEPKQA